MDERPPQRNPQEVLDVEFDKLEERIYNLSRYIEGRVNAKELTFLEDTWGEIVHGTQNDKPNVTFALLQTMEDIYKSMMELATISGIPQEEINPDALKVYWDSFKKNV
jgi:hypothetical protein